MCPDPSSLALWAAAEAPAFLTEEMLWNTAFFFFFLILILPIFFVLLQQKLFYFWVKAVTNQINK